MKTTSISVLGIVATGVFALNAHVYAQDALGAGNTLDANLGTTNNQLNRAISQTNFQARNLLVTGNIAGGRGFRGSVGYGAAGDFMGSLGSEDLYNYRANSAFSSINFVNYGQTFQQLRFGQQAGLIEYQRTGYGSTAEAINMPRYGQSELADIQMRLDRLSRIGSTDHIQAKSVEPTIVGMAQTEEGANLILTASSLRGISSGPQGEHVQLIGLSSFDLARMREDLEAGRSFTQPGKPFEQRFTDLRREATTAFEPMKDERQDNRRTPGWEPEYQKILERVAKRYGDSDQYDVHVQKTLLDKLDEEMDDLRLQLSSKRGLQTLPETTGDETVTPEMPDISETPTNGEPSSLLDTSSLFDIKDEVIDEDGNVVEDPQPLDQENIAHILRHGQTVEKLSAAAETRFNEIMRSAEELLREGEYFRAEQRFERALQFVPNHPLAQVGAAHAQIGAGLHLAASLSLRNLLTQHPEMIDTTYGEGLLPDRELLVQITQTMLDRLEVETRQRSSTAFMLAYLGHQLDDRVLVAKALDALAEEEPEDTLLPLLRDIWLAEPEPEETSPTADSDPSDESPDSDETVSSDEAEK